MNESQYKPIIKLNPLTLTLMIVGLVIIIALIFGIKAMVDNSQKQGEFAINNLPDKVRNMPRGARMRVQRALYSAVRSNVPYDQDIPKNGAAVRENQTVISTKDPNTNVYHATFIVDIEALQQSYNIQVEWVDEKAYEKNMSGHPTVISCVDESDIIYKDFDCTNLSGSSDGSNVLVMAHSSAVIGNFLKLKNSGIKENIYRKVYGIIVRYFGDVYGTEYYLSLDKGAFNVDENKYSFDLTSVKKDRYHVTIETQDNNFKLTISTDNDELYSYDSSLFKAAKRNPKAANKRYLPYNNTTTNSHRDYTFKEYNDDQYILYIESCGKKAIEEEALTEVKEWLNSNDFDPADFKIKIRAYCDREGK